MKSKYVKKTAKGTWQEIEVVYGLKAKCPYCGFILDESDVNMFSDTAIEECEKYSADVVCPSNKCAKVFKLMVKAL
jgi:rubredoxin